MSSIQQKEHRKSAPKSPIPRSRSDFSYVGLTPKEKRWSTDLSLLLPTFSRDSTGYSRLTETPVTLQPKPQSQDVSKLSKSPTLDSSTLQVCKTGTKHMTRSSPIEANISKSNTAECLSINRKKRYPLTNYTILDPHRHVKCDQSILRSPTMDPKTLQQQSHLRTLNSIIISRSSTLDPNILSRSPKETNRGPQVMDASGAIANKCTLCSGVNSSPSEVIRSQSLRSLRRAQERSPSKIRNSESAQSDVTSTTQKPSTLLEADEYDEEDIRRLRNFSVTPKGLINWGDSFRSHSLTSVPGLDHFHSCSGSQWDIASTKSYPMDSSQSQWHCSKPPQRYKVVIMGADDVGKTSLIRQFQTSEYICAFDTSYDVNKEYAITVILNEEESELEFVEYRCPDEELEEREAKGEDSQQTTSIPFADAHVIIYSVTNRRSFLRALDLLSKVQRLFRKSAILLVGNKSDLVRVRAVTTDEGQTSAKERNSSFIETSAAINHQVDELLVSILTQIRTKCKAAADSSGKWNNSPYTFSRAKGLIKKFLKKACFQSKSSDNLQRL